jgi:hypothetical protein
MRRADFRQRRPDRARAAGAPRVMKRCTVSGKVSSIASRCGM